MALPGALALGAFLYRGLDPGAVVPRIVGHGEKPCVEPPANDPTWPFKVRDAGQRNDLTEVPVRVTTRMPARMSPTDFKPDVLIIGGAAAGLAAAASLKRRGVHNIVVLDKNESSGDIWRSRYHRLHLHDVAEECSLPGLDIPRDFPVFCTRQQYAEYLESYVRLLDLPVRNLSTVTKMERVPANGSWVVNVANLHTGLSETYTAKHVVLANGIYNDAAVPKVPGQNTFKGLQVHSSRYTNAADLGLKGKRVLVVGFGNSSGEIAVDLCEHGAMPTILARSPQTIVPRWFIEKLEHSLYTHVMPLARLPFGWALALALGLLVDPLSYAVQAYCYPDMAQLGIPLSLKPPAYRFLFEQEPPLMDVGTVELARRGALKVIGLQSITRIYEDAVEFTNGVREPFAAIVWATGYEQFAGHRHFMGPELLARCGTGVEALLTKRILPGSQHPDLPGLWHNFGRLQMVRDGSRRLAGGIAASLGATSPYDAIDAGDSWAATLAKHAVVGTAALFVRQQLAAPTSKL